MGKTVKKTVCPEGLAIFVSDITDEDIACTIGDGGEEPLFDDSPCRDEGRHMGTGRQRSHRPDAETQSDIGRTDAGRRKGVTVKAEGASSGAAGRSAFAIGFLSRLQSGMAGQFVPVAAPRNAAAFASGQAHATVANGWLRGS